MKTCVLGKRNERRKETHITIRKKVSLVSAKKPNNMQADCPLSFRIQIAHGIPIFETLLHALNYKQQDPSCFQTKLFSDFIKNTLALECL